MRFFYKILVRVGLLPEIINSERKEHVFVARNASIINSYIDRYSSIGRNTKVNNSEIGAFCSISYDCVIGATGHPIDHLSTHAFAFVKSYGFVNNTTKWARRTCIGNDVWIGTHAIIMPGVVVGNGAVIGAGSVVTKNVPDYAIVGGVPAKVLRYRFSDEIIDFLMKVKWWEKSVEDLRSNIEVFNKKINSVDDLKMLEL